MDATHSLTITVTDVQETTNGPPTFPATTPATLEIAENNAKGAPVGTVAATDPDGDALTYALDSASDAVFDIDSTGAITVKWSNALDHEKKASYAVTVSVHDGKDASGNADTAVDATHSLTVSVRMSLWKPFGTLPNSEFGDVYEICVDPSHTARRRDRERG